MMIDIESRPEFFRGHQIQRVNGQFVYTDTGESTVTTWAARGCGHCGLADTPEGHDGCLGEIPGVLNACCGHGIEADAYVQTEDNLHLRGRLAVEWMIERLRRQNITLTAANECWAELAAEHGFGALKLEVPDA